MPHNGAMNEKRMPEKPVLIALVAAVIIAVTSWISNHADPDFVPEDITSDLSVCEEDMPCWDCETMGNLICGDQP